MRKGTVGKIIGAIVIVGAVAAAGLWGWNYIQDKGFRVIAVEELNGDVAATGQLKSAQLNKGEHLYDGDNVSVGEASNLTLCTDKSRYLYADEKTTFSVESKSSGGENRLTFNMSEGSTLHELKTKLTDGESYEVITPTSTMSVRGTTFRVTIYEAEDGTKYTLLEVFEGVVVVHLRDYEGNDIGEEREFTKGQSALIRGDSEITEYVEGNAEEYVWELDYTVLPTESVPRLIALLDGKGFDSKPKKVEKTGSATGTASTTTSTTTSTSTAASASTNTNSNTEANQTSDQGNDQSDDQNTQQSSDSQSNSQHVHSYTWTRVSDPSCEEPGEEKGTCSCGAIETREVAALGHDFSQVIETIAPGCETEGSTYYCCSRCQTGKEQPDITPAVGHNWVNDANAMGVMPTCNSTGSFPQHCERCGATRSEELPIDPNNHAWGGWEEFNAMGGGTEWRRECSRCGAQETSATDPNG